MTSVFKQANEPHVNSNDRTVYNILIYSLVTSIYNLHVLIVSLTAKNKHSYSFCDTIIASPHSTSSVQFLNSFLTCLLVPVARQLRDAWTYCSAAGGPLADPPAVPHFLALSPHNLPTAWRTPADSRVGTDPTCAAPTRLPTELKVKRVTLSDYNALPNPTLPSVCLVHATQSVGMLREGEQW
jgi:hypothetical protein